MKSPYRRAYPALPVRAGLFAVAGLLLLLPVTGCRSHRKARSSSNTDKYSDKIQQVVSSAKVSMLGMGDFGPDQPLVQKFYADRAGELAWSRDGKPTRTALALIQLFTEADKKGLRPEDYDGQQWQEHLHRLNTGKGDEDTISQFDVAMTVAAIRYLSDLHLGRINPQALNFDIDVPARRAAFDVATLINDKVVDADDPGDVVRGVEPDNPMYKATEAALPHYLELAEKVSAQPLAELPPVSGSVAAGGSYPGMQALAARLALEDDGTVTPSGNQYTAEAAAAVKHFQGRMGLSADGKLSAATLAAMNVPMSVRVQQIDDSLEKWRWLPENYVKPRLLVNLPEYLVRAYGPDGDLAFKMRVVVGQNKDGHDTPVFVRTMRYLIFRPYWNLPVSIVKKDLLKHLGGGSGYLEAHGYEVVGPGGKPVTGWTEADLEHSRYLVRQKPGPKNSLGLIKFMFPNEYDVYMHSTPEMNLFALTQRDRSHGCVRLQDAEKMANWVLDGQGDWDADKVHLALFGQPLAPGGESGTEAPESGAADPDSGQVSTAPQVKDNKQVNLKTPLPVVITYLTANADEDGTMHFFQDMYGYDKLLNEALQKPRPYPRAPVKINPHLVAGETE